MPNLLELDAKFSRKWPQIRIPSWSPKLFQSRLISLLDGELIFAWELTVAATLLLLFLVLTFTMRPSLLVLLLATFKSALLGCSLCFDGSTTTKLDYVIGLKYPIPLNTCKVSAIPCCYLATIPFCAAMQERWVHFVIVLLPRMLHLWRFAKHHQTATVAGRFRRFWKRTITA